MRYWIDAGWKVLGSLIRQYWFKWAVETYQTAKFWRVMRGFFLSTRIGKRGRRKIYFV